VYGGAIQMGTLDGKKINIATNYEAVGAYKVIHFTSLSLLHPPSTNKLLTKFEHLSSNFISGRKNGQRKIATNRALLVSYPRYYHSIPFTCTKHITYSLPLTPLSQEHAQECSQPTRCPQLSKPSECLFPFHPRTVLLTQLAPFPKRRFPLLILPDLLSPSYPSSPLYCLLMDYIAEKGCYSIC
jgi:hypothetical protein